MKKFLLTALILTTSAFGANPGDNVPESSGGKGTVGVPMEVRVTVLPKGPQLVLLDENNMLIDKLTFDHGNMVAGLSGKSVVEKEVRLARADGKAFSDDGSKTYTAKFEAKNLSGSDFESISSTDDDTKKIILEGHGAASGEKIDSTLAYKANNIDVKGSDKMIMTKVVSTINKIPEEQKEGLYVGVGTFNATLTMK